MIALCMLALILGCLWSMVIGPLAGLVLSRQQSVDVLSERLDHLLAVDLQAPSLLGRQKSADAELHHLGIFWSGRDPSAIAAGMQEIIRSAARQSGGIVTSSSALANDISVQPGMLAVRARVEGPLDALKHVLEAVDEAKPRLFVDSLSVAVAAPATRDHPEQLSFEFSAAGYFAPFPNAH
jgi:hypothetical protein